MTKSGKQLFEIGKLNMPTKAEVSDAAIAKVFEKQPLPEEVKSNFSYFVQEVEKTAYAIYLERERAVYATVLDNFVADGSNKLIDEEKFSTLDRFFKSLSNSRMSRAGDTFELNLKNLLSQLSYPFMHQPKIGSDQPDYILPSIAHYKALPADCIILTCKRTLRERWKQIVSEGSTGSSFFLATLDEKITANAVRNMASKNVQVIVPKLLKSTKYPEFLNVISFEDFIEDHLDPGVERWKKRGLI